MKQQFILNDGTRPTLEVVKQKHHCYPSLTIQISQVLDFGQYHLCKVEEGAATISIPCRYIYEEIDPVEDSVVYARYIGIEHIKKNYPWWNE